MRAMVFSVLILVGCSSQPSPGRGVFNDAQRPDQATLAEAAAVDRVRGLYNDGLYERAGTELDRLIALGCTHPQAYLLKARLAVQRADYTEAITWSQRAITGSPGWIEPRILIAQVYLKQERWASAGSIFEDIDRLAPKSPWGAYGQAIVQARRGNAAAAATFLAQAIERDPDHQPSLELAANLARQRGDTVSEEAALSRLARLAPDDDDVRVRLGELALSAGRREDAKRQWQRAYELQPRPSTARKLADLARQQGDPAAAQQWSSRAGDQPASEANESAPSHVE